MAFKPNYQQDRSNRNRAKEQKKQEKLRRLQEASERRKETGDVDSPPAGQTPPDTESNME